MSLLQTYDLYCGPLQAVPVPYLKLLFWVDKKIRCHLEKFYEFLYTCLLYTCGGTYTCQDLARIYNKGLTLEYRYMYVVPLTLLGSQLY